MAFWHSAPSESAFLASYSRINLRFTAGKRMWVCILSRKSRTPENDHLYMITSVVYGCAYSQFHTQLGVTSKHGPTPIQYFFSCMLGSRKGQAGVRATEEVQRPARGCEKTTSWSASYLAWRVRWANYASCPKLSPSRWETSSGGLKQKRWDDKFCSFLTCCLLWSFAWPFCI